MLLQPGTVLPGGYEILEKIGAGGMGEVLLARSQATGVNVAVKVLSSRADAEPERFDREVRAAARIRHPNVVEFLDVGQTATGLSFYVMEYLDGENLASTVAREGALPPPRACTLTIQILRALEAAHQRGVIHRDLKPSNCLRIGTPGDEIIKLLDFGIAKVSGEDLQETNLTRTGSVLGTPSYMSPEQAVGGQVDLRADIYSAGVILFELLTGQVPFTSSSPMGVLSRHINEPPPRPRQVAPEADISPELEAIVLRALAKRPQDRFERAAELAEALQQVLSQARREALPAGTFRRPERLYGRGPERAALLDAFTQAVAGGRAFVLLTGEAGVGKSAVVHDVLGARARLAYAKLDQHDPDARSLALPSVLRQLVARVVTHDRDVVMALRQDLEAELGLGLRVLVELVPELAALVGPQPAPAPAGPSASRNRLQAALLRGLRVFARFERPLVLFIDDLQWADAATVELLTAAATEIDVEHLLVVATVRDGAVDPASGLGLALHELRRQPTVQTVHVGPLHLEDVAMLVGDTLGAGPSELEGLAREVQRRAEGNPLFVHQLLRAAYDAGILAFDHPSQRWRWRTEALGDDRFADVAELLSSQLERLPEASRALLGVAACVGVELDLALLSAVLEQEPHALEPRLRPAVELELVEGVAGLVERTGGRYRFVHDRVRQAALAKVPPEALAGLHLGIGRWLAAQAPGAVPSLSAVAHMIRGQALLHDPGQRRELARHSLAVSHQARGTTDYDGARRLLEAGVSLLDRACWDEDHALAFALHLERAEISYLAGDFDAAAACYGALAPFAATPVEALEVDIQQVTLHLSRGMPQQSLAIGMLALARHGVAVPATAAERVVECERALGRIQEALAGRSVLELVDAPPCDDPVSRALLRLLTELIAPAHLTENELADLLICTLVELSLRRGSSEASAYGYVLFAFFLATRSPDTAAHEFGRLALLLNERWGDPSQDSRLHFVFGSILHCFEPLPAALRHFERALAVGLESGDHVFASYACSHTLIALIGLGAPLADVRERARRYLQVMGRTRVASSTAVVKLALRVVACLQGETEGPAALGDATFDEAAFVEEIEGANLGFSCLWYDVIKLQLLTLEGDHAGAMAALERAERRRTNSAWFLSTELAFYRAMLLAARARSRIERGRDASELLEGLRQALPPVARWAELCPQSYAHKALLLRAELAMLEGRGTEALGLYDRAVVRARADGFCSTEALAAERAAACCLVLGHDGMAGMLAGAAEAAYLRWGAVARAGAVRARYLGHIEGSGWPRAGQDPAATHEEAPGSTQAGSDLFARAVALSRVLADEDDFDRLGHRVLEHVVKATKTDRGLLAIERGGVLRVEATYVPGEGDHTRSTPWPVDTQADAPILPLKRAFWTGEVLLVDDVVDNARFANDTYLQRHRPRSILCLPLRAYGRRFGLLYLESRDSYAHFTPGVLDLMLMVTTQLAVALHAARPDSSGRSSKHILPDDATRADG